MQQGNPPSCAGNRKAKLAAVMQPVQHRITAGIGMRNARQCSCFRLLTKWAPPKGRSISARELPILRPE